MNNIIVTFVRPAPTRILASNNIARFLSRTLDLPLFFTPEVRRQRPDILFLVNGPYAFSPILPDIARVVERAERIVWIQNDYTIRPPLANGNAASPFRRAFVKRHEAGKSHVDYWTTVKSSAKLTTMSRYVNWNALSYRTPELEPRTRKYSDTAFYYGAFRAGRVDAFDRYFRKPRVPTVISSPTTGRAPPSKKFTARYPQTTVVPAFLGDALYHAMNTHGIGLYLEDASSHTAYHSPANRFYEMLSAGLPMVFQPESLPMLRKAGYDVDKFLVEHARDVATQLRHRNHIAREQAEWWQSYRKQLKQRISKLYTELMERH